MSNIESRCGLECSKCGFGTASGGACTGCVLIKNPFWGECPVKKCCEDKELDNCGFCPDFSCELLNGFAFDKENGDESGSRLEICRKWRKERK